jgi:hypothetical protein
MLKLSVLSLLSSNAIIYWCDKSILYASIVITILICSFASCNNSYYTKLYPKFIKNLSSLLETFLNKAYNSIEWAIQSPPKPHTFALPLLSLVTQPHYYALFYWTIAATSTAVTQLDHWLDLAISFVEYMSAEDDFTDDTFTEAVEEYKSLIISASGWRDIQQQRIIDMQIARPESISHINSYESRPGGTIRQAIREDLADGRHYRNCLVEESRILTELKYGSNHFHPNPFHPNR